VTLQSQDCVKPVKERKPAGVDSAMSGLPIRRPRRRGRLASMLGAIVLVLCLGATATAAGAGIEADLRLPGIFAETLAGAGSGTPTPAFRST